MRIKRVAGTTLLVMLATSVIYSASYITTTINKSDDARSSSDRRPCPSSSDIDWKSIDVDSLPAELVMEYFHWFDRYACRLAHGYGGVVMNRATVIRIMGKVNPFSKSGARYPAGLDGQYPVCLDPPSVAPPPEKCLVYSFGINNEWSFDDAMVLYGCQVYAFDPSMSNKTKRGPNIHFYDWAVSEVDDPEYKSFTLSTIYDKLKPLHGDGAVIDYLKIDIEHDEWLVVPQIVQSGFLDKVRQLVMEVHVWTKEEHIDSYRSFVAVLKSLEDYGMIRFDSKYTPWCPAHLEALNYTGPICFQIAWYNSRFIIK